MLRHLPLEDIAEVCESHRSEDGDIDLQSCLDCGYHRLCIDLQQVTPCDWPEMEGW